MKHWLIKSEPEVYSIDDLARDKRTSWEGVRNYQARNFLRDGMKKGDGVLFYHSNAEPPGVAGVARVVRGGYPDTTTKQSGWVMVDVEFVQKFERFVPLEELKKNPKLKSMLVVQRGQRLSVQPVDKAHFDIVASLDSVRTPNR